MDDVTPTGATVQAEPPSPAVPTPRSKRKWLVGGLSLVFLLCGATDGSYWAFIGRFAESTDDAYVAGNVVPLTPQVNGTVIAIRADSTQLVKQGQTVVLLDSTDARIALDQSKAQLAQAVRQVQGLYQTEAQQEANVFLEQARLAQSKIDYRRDSNLVMQKFGRIINLGSCNAERMPFAGGAVYAMSKAALVGLVKGLARDLGPRGITINNIQPGPVDTQMNPATGEFADMLKKQMALPRYANVDEIAAMVAYLASPEAGFVTGASLTIDGGFTA